MPQTAALNSLRIIYKNNRPHGIRDENGFLIFFPVITKFPGQEERYRNEIEKQFSLADSLLKSLKANK